MKSELIRKNLESLVVIKALASFFYNFTQAQIEELIQKSTEFKHTWKQLCDVAEKRQKKNGWPATIDHTEFYDAFSSKISYATQALIVEKALEVYGDIARSSINFSISVECQFEKTSTDNQAN